MFGVFSSPCRSKILVFRKTKGNRMKSLSQKLCGPLELGILKKSGLVSALALVANIYGAVALAEPCQCGSRTPDDSYMAGSSDVWGPYEILFDQKVRGRGIYKASLCSSQTIQISSVKLWMPDMGHGSSPTALEFADDQCIKVSKVNFMMPGMWEVQVIYKDGSIARSTIEVP